MAAADLDTLVNRIVPVARDLGEGFVVRRALPAKACRIGNEMTSINRSSRKTFCLCTLAPERK